MTPEKIEALNAQRRKHYREHAQEISAHNNGPDSWKARHRERVAELMKEYRLKNIAADCNWGRRAAYKKRYGITLEQYEEMLTAQGHACAICFGSPRGRKNLHVDHDHQTDTIRGLLCWRCNAALGNLDENIAVLTSMIAYLSAHRSSERPAINHGSAKPQLGASAEQSA